jgi:hypothetical protein
MYMPNFLDGFDRLVAFDAETKRSIPALSRSTNRRRLYHFWPALLF